MNNPTIKDVQSRIDAITSAAVDRGMAEPDLSIRVSSCGGYAYLNWYEVSPETGYKERKSKLVNYQGAYPEPALAGIAEFVESQKTADELEVANATRLVALALEASRKVGLEPEFTNPLEAIMKKLSENVITDQRGKVNPE